MNSPFGRICLLLLMAMSVNDLAAQTTSDYDLQIQHGRAQLQAGSADHAIALGEAAIKIDPDRWEGYALIGDSLLNLKRYEDAADALSKAIERAPQSEQTALRDTRRQSLLAESGIATPAKDAAPRSPGPAEIASSNSMGRGPEGDREGLGDAVWVDPSSGLMWARPWYYPIATRAGPWNQADSAAYCSGLRLLAYSNWRLPTLDETKRIFLLSSKGWMWNYPEFDAAYGVNDALKRGVWKPASFSVAGDTFSGNRLLLWTSTPGDKPGEHAAVYFGKRYSVSDDLKVGISLPGSSIRNPFQGYAFCVRNDR
jgi:tetratricopeptide (TPR) repeat protein